MLVKLAQELFFQVAPGRLLDRAALGRDGLFVGLALLARPRVGFSREVGDARTARPYPALVWFRIRIHTRG